MRLIASFHRATAPVYDTHATAARLNLGTAVLAWMRLGQIHDMRGERKEAVAAYREAVRYAPGSEVAKESKGYGRSAYRRR